VKILSKELAYSSPQFRGERMPTSNVGIPSSRRDSRIASKLALVCAGSRPRRASLAPRRTIACVG
jgi:hypothetical protein